MLKEQKGSILDLKASPLLETMLHTSIAVELDKIYSR